MFLLALTAQLSLPTLTDTRVPDVREILSYADFPQFLLKQGDVDRIVYTRTTVRPDGTIDNCAAEASSGDQRLDVYTCALIVKRAKFLPARWVDGSAVYGVLRMPVHWLTLDSVDPPSEEVPDLDLSVNHLPKGAHSFVDVNLQIAADDKGHPVSCVEWAPSMNDRRKRFPELVPIACQQATASLLLTPAVDASHKPTRSVQSVTVRFRLGK
jgi:hypothetical protein